MADIMVNPSGLQRISEEYRSIVGTLSNIRSEIGSVKSGLGFQLPSRAQIERSLDGIGESIERFSRSANSMSSALTSIQRAYTNTEERLSGVSVSGQGIDSGNFNFEDFFKHFPNLPGGILPGGFGWVIGVLNNFDINGEASFWDKVKEAYGNVVQAGRDCVSWVKEKFDEAIESYKNKGTVYKWVQYGKAALKVGSGIVKMAGALATIFGTAGGSIPLAWTTLLSGGNDIINGLADMTYVHYEMYDDIGTTNALKQALQSGGGYVGEFLGNREAGELLGNTLYTGFEAVTFLNGVDKMIKSFGRAEAYITNAPVHSKILGDITIGDMFDSSGNRYSFGDIIYDLGKGVYSSLKSAFKFGGEIGELAR